MVPEDDGHGNGLLGRGWSPSPRVRATALVVVGLLVILNPLVGGLPDAVGLTGTAEYAAAEITPEGGDLSLAWVEERERSVRGVLDVSGGLTLLDCFPGFVTSRACGLESSLTDRSVTVPEEPVGWSGYTYHDRLYERTVGPGSGGVTLSLRPVSARTVLANISAPAANAPDAVRRAVETGSVRADAPLDSTGLVLERSGSYYVVLPTESEPRPEPAGPVYTAASTAVGLLLVQRGRRIVAGGG